MIPPVGALSEQSHVPLLLICQPLRQIFRQLTLGHVWFLARSIRVGVRSKPHLRLHHLEDSEDGADGNARIDVA